LLKPGPASALLVFLCAQTVQRFQRLADGQEPERSLSHMLHKAPDGVYSDDRSELKPCAWFSGRPNRFQDFHPCGAVQVRTRRAPWFAVLAACCAALHAFGLVLLGSAFAGVASLTAVCVVRAADALRSCAPTRKPVWPAQETESALCST
jgi:hypothetical protein